MTDRPIAERVRQRICLDCGVSLPENTREYPFTICDDCWDKKHPSSTTPRPQLDREELTEALENMVRQFAHQVVKGGVPSLSTGGLSALEEAFAVLGWDDPYPSPEGGCEHLGCAQWATCGTPTKEGYKRLCHAHFRAALADNAPTASHDRPGRADPD